MMFRSLAALVLMTASVSANAGNLNLCVYDPSGANGDAFQLMKEYRIAALGWGVDFKLKPYTDEKTAAEDFKAGQCDGVVLTGTRVRSFQKFTGTIEAMGAVPSYDHFAAWLVISPIQSWRNVRRAGIMRRLPCSRVGLFTSFSMTGK